MIFSTGTNAANFESHLCEVMYRNQRGARSKLFSNFLSDLLELYSLEEREVYTYPKPMFNTFCESEQDYRNSSLYSVGFDEGIECEISGESDEVFQSKSTSSILSELPVNLHRDQMTYSNSQSSGFIDNSSLDFNISNVGIIDEGSSDNDFQISKFKHVTVRNKLKLKCKPQASSTVTKDTSCSDSEDLSLEKYLHKSPELETSPPFKVPSGCETPNFETATNSKEKEFVASLPDISVKKRGKGRKLKSQKLKYTSKLKESNTSVLVLTYNYRLIGI